MRDSRASREHAQHRRPRANTRSEDRRQPPRHLRQRQAGHAAQAAVGRPHRIRLSRFLPADLRLRRRRDDAADGAAFRRRIRIGDRGHARRGGCGGQLGKLRAVMEVARTLQTSLSSQDVLISVVDAALAVTGAERGFLLLRNDGELEMRVARDRSGTQLARDRSARAPAGDPPRARAAPRSALDELRFTSRGYGGAQRGRSGSAQRGLRAAGAHQSRDQRRYRHAVGGRRDGGRALHGFAPGRGRPGRRQSRAAADAGDRSLDHPRKRAPARRGARQAEDRGRAERGPQHPAEPASAQAAGRRAGFAPRAAVWRRSRWAAITSM